MHDMDWIERVRRNILPILHSILSKFGLYAAGDVGDTSYSCTTHASEEQLEKMLVEAGFMRNPIAALKYRIHKQQRYVSEGSWFFFTMNDPIYVLGIFELPRWQYHLTIFDDPDSDGQRCYIHKEYWWGTEPVKHYNVTDYNAVPRWLRDKFDEEGIEYEINE